MKKVFRKNLLVIIFLLLGFVVAGQIFFINNKNITSEIKIIEKTKKYCINNIENITQDEAKQSCEKIMNNDYVIQSQNFYVKFASSYLDVIGYFNIVASLIIFIVSIYKVVNVFKDRVVISVLEREKYSHFIRKLIFKMYRYCWFWVAIMLLIFGVCMINSTFDSETLINSGMSWKKSLMDNVPMFIFLYLLNILIFTIFYLNIALIAIRKQHNYFLAVIKSFLIIIGIEIFLEIVVQSIFFGKILGNYDAGLVFNIMNLFSFNVDEYSHGLVSLFSFNCICLLISYLVMYMAYHNKEKLIIDCEKNN